jgi:two-component system sensor histidine kinase TtrS
LSTLGEMASGMAHELNQPLTAITTNARACIRLIEDGRGSVERCGEVMSRIGDQAERAGEIIRHLRRLVRKEAPELGPVAVTDLFETVVVLIHQDARQHEVKVETNVEERADAVLVQRTQIEQVILNVARNAIEAMSESSAERRLVLSARRTRRSEGDHTDSVRISIDDSGPGIAEPVRERLFEPFVTTKPEGLGLGLSISAGIVETHGGKLIATASDLGGACFRFELPAVKNADAATEMGAPSHEEH